MSITLTLGSSVGIGCFKSTVFCITDRRSYIQFIAQMDFVLDISGSRFSIYMACFDCAGSIINTLREILSFIIGYTGNNIIDTYSFSILQLNTTVLFFIPSGRFLCSAACFFQPFFNLLLVTIRERS